MEVCYNASIMITVEQLKDRYIYNPDTGLFTRICKTGGKHTGKTLSKNKSKYDCGHIQYKQITINGKVYQAHRLAWLYMTGKWPENFVDHINRDSSDNRWNNLREATYTENNRNRSIGKDNTSGYKGVSFHKGTNKYRAEIKINGKNKHLGYYDDPYIAHTAYMNAAYTIQKEYATNGI